MSFRKETLAEGVEVYLGDCLEVLPTLATGFAVVTDPPYGISYQHGARRGGKLLGTDGKAIHGDDKPFDPTPWLAFECLMWGAEHFKNRLPDGGRWLVWNKRRTGVVRDQGDVENAWHSVTGVTRIFHHVWDGADLGPERGEARVHSNQKPIDLMRWCLTQFVTAPHILDPYCGSGTTGVAAVKLGRKFTGVEIDPDHFDSACRRIEAATREPDMFIAPPKPIEQTSMFSEDAA
jgi:site-specific DNA-methyltransferase (adenine-specific)